MIDAPYWLASPSEMMSLSDFYRPSVHIVIPCFNKWELTHQRLWELYRLERGHIKSILVVNNGSTDETEQGLSWWESQDFPEKPKISHITLEENIGFLRASNIGIGRRVSCSMPSDITILLSNDVQIRTKFIDQIYDILKDTKALVGGKLLSQDTGWNNIGGKIYPYLEGWFLATAADTWHRLGYFDERFAPQDFEDVDLSTTALSMGYELVPLNNIGLVHMGAQTYGYNPEREANTIKNKEKFGEKWNTKNSEK